MFAPNICQKARLSRDPRFDGLFYVAVKSTGIYCRPVCPAPPAAEKNVDYFQYAHNAAQAGFRPCLRCRPDSAPGSYPWLGSETTALRAKQLIDQGYLQHHSSEQFAARLGVSPRYVSRLFKRHLGIAPLQYALFQQCHFAKQLLQQTDMPISDVAFASGFNSIRRFNDAFKKQLSLTPRDIRRKRCDNATSINLMLGFRPPYNWQALHGFLSARLIPGLEWLTATRYGRTFNYDNCRGGFEAVFNEQESCFNVSIELDDLSALQGVVANIRRVLDLDADTGIIESLLADKLPADFTLVEGLRLPGIWSSFEAGVRAVLGQQVSVSAARNLVKQLVDELGENVGERCYFPVPQAVADSELAFFKMPEARKNALRALARHCADEQGENNPDSWLSLKGIGPWTVNYAKLRGQSAPDVFLDGDLGVKKALAGAADFEPSHCAPFRSYLTFQLWQQL